jgi:hypothetical protein
MEEKEETENEKEDSFKFLNQIRSNFGCIFIGSAALMFQMFFGPLKTILYFTQVNLIASLLDRCNAFIAISMYPIH